MHRQSLAVALLLLIVSACGGGGSTATSPTPTPPAPQANRNPTIDSISVTPVFGVATFTSYTFASSASDLDNDSLTYSWDLPGNPGSGPTQSITLTSGGDFTGTLTVSDGRGGTASQSVAFTVATTTGNWGGSVPFSGAPLHITSNMTQSTSSGATTANWSIPLLGLSGILDPAAQNGIDANGRVVLRFKITKGIGFLDFTFSGQMQPSGRSIAGTINGLGLSNQPMTLTK